MKKILALLGICFLLIAEANEDNVRLSSFRQEIDKAISLLNHYKFDDFQKQVLFIEKEFVEYNNDISFLMQKGTFAQRIEPKSPEIADKIFLEIITKDPLGITISDDRMFNAADRKKREDAVNFLKRGTIWGFLNNKTAKYTGSRLDTKTKNELIKIEVKKLIAELRKTSEGTRCIPFAQHWEVVATRKNPSNTDFAPVKSFLPPPQLHGDKQKANNSQAKSDVIVSKDTRKNKNMQTNATSSGPRVLSIREIENKNKVMKQETSSKYQVMFWLSTLFIALSMLLFMAYYLSRFKQKK